LGFDCERDFLIKKKFLMSYGIYYSEFKNNPYVLIFLFENILEELANEG
jgi:hypothetical protein